jgi:RNA polymerase sigma-70 factor, ECF subfamily
VSENADHGAAIAHPAPGRGRLGRWARRLTVDDDAPDLELVEAAKAGDRRAFSRLYGRYGKMVHGALLARVPPGEVEDLVQDVFLAAIRRLPTLRAGESVGGWLLAIARNRAVDYYRRRRPTAELRDVSGVAPPHAEAAQALEVIRGLPEAYRETLVMRLVEGMTGPEIAARTGLTPASVRVNLHRGMKLLREALEGEPS